MSIGIPARLQHAAVRAAILPFLMAMAPLAKEVRAQCPNNNTLTGAAITVTCPTTVNVPCVQGGQYALVNVVAGNIYTFSTCGGASFDTEITVYNNTGGASVAYNDDGCGLQSQVQWTATFTGQVRVLVDQFPCASNTTCIPLSVSCAAPPPPLTNNEPCQPRVLAVTTLCFPSAFTSAGATTTVNPNIPAPGCGNFGPGSGDVWFQFIAPPSGIAIIETGAGTLTDAAMALYTATPNCTGTFTLVDCDDDTGPGLMPFLSFTNLVPGQAYYIRLWGFGTSTGTFTICVHGPTAPPPSDCVYLLELFDSFGDGWGGSFITISVNGVPQGNYTLNTAFDAFLFGVDVGDVLVVQYTAVGPFEGDNLYNLSLLPSNQIVYNSGSPPTTGVAYTTTVTCVTPLAPPEDCVGGITICNSLGINNNTSFTGNVADLTAANYGCLLAAEQQGTWYNFSIASGGTLGFTIDPSGNDDYDWAIWGPFAPGSTTSTVCPPAAGPIRCSFASGASSFLATGGYNTGMGINNIAWANPQFAAPTPGISDPVGGDGWTPGINVTTGQVYLMYISNFSLSGQSFTLGWQLGAGASLDCTVLPVELVALEAVAAGPVNRITWATATEQGTAHFTVQRSVDGRAYDDLGRLPAQGNSGEMQHYAFQDDSPPEGVAYYRLVMVDSDGSAAVSPARTVIRTGGSAAEQGPFPNPLSGMITWAIPRSDRPTFLNVFDSLGRQVLGTLVPANASVARFAADTLPAGTYLLVLTSEQGAVLQRSVAVR
jgi:hypothetical protein